MASRFWVGGVGSWDASTTTHWSATTGGAGGASVPTSADDVFLDGNSGTGLVTVTGATGVCRSLTCTGYTGSLTLTNSLNVGDALGGAVLLVAGMTFTNNATLGLIASTNNTGAGWSLTTAGKSMGSLNFAGGASGMTTFQDACTAGAVTHTSGTINTNGKTCTWISFISSNSNVRTITMGASAISCSAAGATPWDCTTSANLTITANTATITLSGATVTWRGGGLNWNGLSLVFTGGGVSSLGNGGTYANVTYTGTAVKNNSFNGSSANTITVTGVLTVTGSSIPNRVFMQGVTIGTAMIWSLANAPTLTNVDFMDVSMTGAAAPVSGTSLGDALGNSGITFTVAVTRFAVAPGNVSSTAMWSATTGGASGASMPLPQDTVKFDANSAAGTYTMDMARFGLDIDFTGFTRTFTHASIITWYGSWTAASGMTWGGAGGMTCAARSSVNFTTNGKTVPTTINIIAPGGTLTFQDNVTGNAAIGIAHTAGTLNTNGKTVAYGSITTGGALTRSLILGASLIQLTGTGTAWNVTAITGLTFDAGTSIIDFTDTSATAKTFQGFGLTYSTIRHKSTGSGNLVITGSNLFSTLDIECTTARQLILAQNSTQIVVGTTTIQGASGQLLTLASNVANNDTTLWAMGTLVQSNTSLTADVILAKSHQVATQNLITDTRRTAALSWATTQNFGMTDGETVPAGFGIHRSATNLFRHSQCETSTDYGSSGGATIATDATVVPPFSTQSIKVTTPGSIQFEGVACTTANTLSLAAATQGAGSIYIKGVAGQSYDVWVRWVHSDASTVDGTHAVLVATGNWQSIPTPAVAVAATKTGIQVALFVRTSTVRAESFWVAHPMIESGHPYVAPYIPTTGGNTSAFNAGRLQVPAAVVDETQGWYACRVRMQTAAANGAAGGFFEWGDDINNRFSCTGVGVTGQLRVQRRNASGIQDSSGSGPIGWTNAGDFVTLVFAWTATQLFISANGGTFVVVSTTPFIPVIANPAFDIGSGHVNVAITALDGDLIWAATGLGILTQTDAGTLNTLGNTSPTLNTLPVTAQQSWILASPSTTYTAPLDSSAASLTGTTTLTGSPSVLYSGTASLSGTTTLAGTPSVLLGSPQTLSGVSTLAGIGTTMLVGAGNLIATSTLAGLGTLKFQGSGTLTGTSRFTGSGVNLQHNTKLESVDYEPSRLVAIESGNQIPTVTGVS